MPPTHSSVATRPEPVSVLREYPELARALEPSRATRATRDALASVIFLPKGEFCAEELIPAQPGTLGVLILQGLLLRAASVDNRPSLEIFGAGDLVRPGYADDSDPFAIVPVRVGWWAMTPTKLAVLDAHFVKRMSEYPEVIAELAGQLWSAAAATRLRLSIVQQRRLTARLHYMLWHLADRFGQVKAEGVTLPVPLCVELLAWAVGASRPAVSAALKELEQDGLLARRPEASWWLGHPPEDLLARSLEAQALAAA